MILGKSNKRSTATPSRKPFALEVPFFCDFETHFWWFPKMRLQEPCSMDALNNGKSISISFHISQKMDAISGKLQCSPTKTDIRLFDVFFHAHQVYQTQIGGFLKNRVTPDSSSILHRDFPTIKPLAMASPIWLVV